MASEIQKRLHEAVDREPYYEARRFKKEAIMVGDNFLSKPQGVTGMASDHDDDSAAFSTSTAAAEARRRRIYENEYNRPYPSTKKLFWTEPTATTATATRNTNTRSTPLPRRLLVTPSPKPQGGKSVDPQQWMSMSMNLCMNSVPLPSDVVNVNSNDVMDVMNDDTVLAPRELWTDQSNNKENNDIPTIESNSKKSHALVETPPRNAKPMQVITPINNRSSKNISPLSLPKDNKNNSSLLQSVCAPLQPVLDSAGIEISMNEMSFQSFVPSNIQSSSDLMQLVTPASFYQNQQEQQQQDNNDSKRKKYKRRMRRARSMEAEQQQHQQSVLPQQQSPPPPSQPKPQNPHESHQKLHEFLKDHSEEKLELHVDDYQESTFDKIVESLYGNSVLETLIVVRSLKTKVGTYRSPSEMECLLEAMRCLPRLRTLLLIHVGSDIMPYLGKNLPSSLQHFQIRMAPPLGGNGTNTANTSIPISVLNALATKEHLLDVHFEVNASLDLGRLVASPSLQRIKISTTTTSSSSGTKQQPQVSMDPAHMQGLGEALASNPYSRLVALDLEPLLDTASWKILAESLHTTSPMKYLRVSYPGGPHPADAEEAVRALGQLIRHNSALTNLNNQCYQRVEISQSVATEAMIEALHSNSSLVELSFFVEDPMVWVAKEALLKRNQQGQTQLPAGCGGDVAAESCGTGGGGSLYHQCLDLVASSSMYLTCTQPDWCAGAGAAGATTTTATHESS